jgi:diphosphomevalonate decarboxylase
VKKSDIVKMILRDKLAQPMQQQEQASAFAPTNIALCKYWGKRDSELNLPMTSSLSIALPSKGAFTHLSLRDAENDLVILNGKELAGDSAFVLRLKQYLDLFRGLNVGRLNAGRLNVNELNVGGLNDRQLNIHKSDLSSAENNWRLQIDIKMSIPVAAGLASSACGFASLILAMNNFFSWDLSQQELSILARLGSGSASRSLWNGFVEWQAGVQSDGMDSYAQALKIEWSELLVGIISITQAEKPISSRLAMQRTVDTSMLYQSWPKKVAHDLSLIKQALQNKNFSLLAGTAESNALAMHATMLNSWPPVCYFLPETIAAMHQVWELRRENIEVYFTQDAGPNLKLLFLEKDKEKIQEYFPEVEVIHLFGNRY